MKNKNGIKILLDIVMILLLVLMFNKNVISMSFHEIGGLVVCGLFVVHMLLNYKWIIGVSKKLFSRGLKFKTRLGYIINAALLLMMAFIGISGILISKTIFTGISSNSLFWKMGHQVVAGYGIILVGIHIGLHWDFLRNHFKKFVKIPVKVQKSLSVICAGFIIVYGVYSMGTSNFTRWLSTPFTVSQLGSGQGKGNNGERPQGVSKQQGEQENKLEISPQRTEDNEQKNTANKVNTEGNDSTQDREAKAKKSSGEGHNADLQDGQGKFQGEGWRGSKDQMQTGINPLRIVSVIGTYLSITLCIAILTSLLETFINKWKKAESNSTSC